MGTADKLAELRFDKMRLGQAACEIESLLSDPEIRVALVPLTEAEYKECMEKSVKTELPENLAGHQFRDRILTEETLLRALREPDDLGKKVFQTTQELNELLDVVDINFLIDCYFEMSEKSNPSLDGITNEQMEDIKKVLVEMDWNALSGTQWYAARRFLSSLGPEQLMAKLPGSSSIKKLIGMSESEESTQETAEENLLNPIAKSAENPS